MAYCRLVETRGSTPQKAGAAMLVYPDGTQDGTLGGGCVEAEVKRRALAVLESATAEVADFQLDHDYGWDDGLICGGRMSVAIVPLLDLKQRPYFAHLSRLLAAGAGAIEAIIVQHGAASHSCTEGAAPRSYLFDEQHQFVTALANESADASATVAATLQSELPKTFDRSRPQVVGGVAHLAITPRQRLIIVGAGHIGQAVAQLAAQLDFDVWIVDDRADCATEERFPDVSRRIVGEMRDVLPSLEVTPSTYCLIVTRGHNHDQEALFHLAERPARYVGLIGSRRKIKLIFDNLRGGRGFARGARTSLRPNWYRHWVADGSRDCRQRCCRVGGSSKSRRCRSGSSEFDPR